VSYLHSYGNLSFIVSLAFGGSKLSSKSEEQKRTKVNKEMRETEPEEKQKWRLAKMK